MVLTLFWYYYYKHPYKLDETTNSSIISAFFYLPLTLTILLYRFLAKISRFHSISLSLLAIFTSPFVYFLTSSATNASGDFAKEFLYFYSGSLPLAIAGILIVFRSIPAYIRLIFRRPQYFLFSTVVILAIGYLVSLELRLYKLFNGYQKFTCSYQEVKKINSPRIARIIGSYSEGSGFFIQPNVVITNRHVVEGEEYPKIVLPSGRFITPLKIELSTKFDIAIITIKESYSDYVVSDKEGVLTPGEEALSFGYPMGSDIKGDPTIIPIKFENERARPEDFTSYLQFSDPLVSGMSGGPTIDKCGDLVGINTISTSGTSLIISYDDLYRSLSDEKTESKKIKLEPGATPKDSVFAYYYLLKARDTEGCYDLLSSEYKKKSTYEEWTARFPNVISVEIFKVEEIKPNLVYVIFGMAEWVNGEQTRKIYEGTWETVKDGDTYLLNKSHILELNSLYETNGPDFFLKPEVK